jgi:hypothetical protein
MPQAETRRAIGFAGAPGRTRKVAPAYSSEAVGSDADRSSQAEGGVNQPTCISIFPIMGYVRKMSLRNLIDMRKSNPRKGMSIMSALGGEPQCARAKLGDFGLERTGVAMRNAKKRVKTCQNMPKHATERPSAEVSCSTAVGSVAS